MSLPNPWWSWVFSLHVLQLLIISVLSSAACRPKRQAADPVVSPTSAKKQLPPQPRRGAQQIYNPPSGKYSATIGTFTYGETHLLSLVFFSSSLFFFRFFLLFSSNLLTLFSTSSSLLIIVIFTVIIIVTSSSVIIVVVVVLS